jgi:hypothetical protein
MSNNKQLFVPPEINLGGDRREIRKLKRELARARQLAARERDSPVKPVKRVDVPDRALEAPMPMRTMPREPIEMPAELREMPVPVQTQANGAYSTGFKVGFLAIFAAIIVGVWFYLKEHPRTCSMAECKSTNTNTQKALEKVVSELDRCPTSKTQSAIKNMIGVAIGTLPSR